MGKTGGGKSPVFFGPDRAGQPARYAVSEERRGAARDMGRGLLQPGRQRAAGRQHGGGAAAPQPAQPYVPRVWEAAFRIGRHAQKILQESDARIRYVQLPGLG